MIEKQQSTINNRQSTIPRGVFSINNQQSTINNPKAKRRRRLFRRIAVGPYERLRTAAERIAMLDVAFIAPSPLAIQQRHDEAFDVEAVTKAFFDDYTRLFEKVFRASP